MPIVEISIARGRDEATLRALLSAVHEAVVSSASVPPASVRVLLREIEAEHWLSGGSTLAEKAATPPA